MTRRIPPLNALRAFEAAGRHLSFAKAAEELNVTPAAVSHQVKALEELLGVPLFRRMTRGVALTDEGRAYLPGLTEGFDKLAEASARIARSGLAGRLAISAIPSFAMRWLLPRLADFRARFPDLDVEVQASVQQVDFGRDEVDVGLRYGRGNWPGQHWELFLKETVFPVCSPLLLAGPQPLAAPSDLKRFTLLHDSEVTWSDSWMAWPRWLALLDAEGVDARRGPRFSDSTMMLEACAAGHGVAIGRESLCEADFAQGRLVRLFGLERPADYDYYFVCSPGTVDRPKIAAFRSWLFEKAAAVRRPDSARPEGGGGDA
jgi:LysR family glycine cleavage system transcriptional activator